jgi:hypothetical protein
MFLKNTLIICLVIWGLPSFAQVVINPVIQSKTHPSLRVDSVYTGDQTICYLSVVNENTEGNAWFCADEDIILIENQSNIKHRMIRSEGIPICPDVHAFNTKGEVLAFQLVFPALENPIGEIDIIENCSDNCFTLKGVVLDIALNQEIRTFEMAVVDFNEGRLVRALRTFESLNNATYKKENHFAYSLYIVPMIHLKLGDEASAKKTYLTLRDSEIINKTYFLKKLHEQEFFRALNP